MRKLHCVITTPSTDTEIKRTPNASWSLDTEILTHRKFVKLQYTEKLRKKDEMHSWTYSAILRCYRAMPEWEPRALSADLLDILPRMEFIWTRMEFIMVLTLAVHLLDSNTKQVKDGCETKDMKFCQIFKKNAKLKSKIASGFLIPELTCLWPAFMSGTRLRRESPSTALLSNVPVISSLTHKSTKREREREREEREKIRRFESSAL